MSNWKHCEDQQKEIIHNFFLEHWPPISSMQLEKIVTLLEEKHSLDGDPFQHSKRLMCIQSHAWVHHHFTINATLPGTSSPSSSPWRNKLSLINVKWLWFRGVGSNDHCTSELTKCSSLYINDKFSGGLFHFQGVMLMSANQRPDRIRNVTNWAPWLNQRASWYLAMGCTSYERKELRYEFPSHRVSQ